MEPNWTSLKLQKHNFLKANTEIIAIKCPLGFTVQHNENSTLIYKRPSESLKESLGIEGEYVYQWRFYDIGTTETKKINCLNIYKNDESHLLGEWNHEITRTSTEQKDIKCKSDFNIKRHIPGENIKKTSGSEITVAFSGK
uniref:Uncharacterized protein n=1 Tax=Strongyloides venezuelensis TaxID=75913 RepID=A0A0K0F3J6_STRVS